VKQICEEDSSIKAIEG